MAGSAFLSGQGRWLGDASWMECEGASRAIDAKRAAVQPKVDLHCEPGVLDRVMQIASASELDLAANRAQRGAAA